MRQHAITDSQAIAIGGREPVGAGIVVVASAGLLYLVVILVQLPGGSQRGDFSIYYACAVAALCGLDPYAINMTDFTRELGFEPDIVAHPTDTPTFTLMTEPLAMLSAPTAYAIWVGASSLCLVGSLLLLFGPSSGLEGKTAILFSLGALGFTPLADNFRWAQSEVFVLLGVLVFFRLFECRRDAFAGAILAGLGLLRGFPLVLGGYLISRRRWKSIVFLAIVFAIGTALTVAILGVTPSTNFLRVLVPLGSGHQWFSFDPQWEIAAANVSLDAFVMRPLMMWFGVDLPRTVALLKGILVMAVRVVILAIAFSATVRNIDVDDRLGRSFSLWTATMLILTPVVWLHYMVLLIVPFGLIAVAAYHEEAGVRVWRFAILGYCFIVLITPLMSILTFRKDIMDWRVSLVAELGFLALLSAWVAAYRFAVEPMEAEFGNIKKGGPAPGKFV
ncbi:MAG TPA: glycosyltransferase family 87 protein [Candidatus Binataceae bacterium]|nr:glycosyltransferase family 87 protein [Candidatus Binataceae bacterium]